MKRKKIGKFWWLGCFWLITVSYGDHDLLNLLNRWSAATVEFKQSSPQGTFQGKIGFKRPALFYLERLKPYYLLKIEKDQMIIYDAEINQVIRQSLVLQEFIPAQILISPERILKHFTVQKKRQGNFWIFMLLPKEQINIVRMQLIFEQNNLKQLNFIDQFQQKTQMVFGLFHTYQPLNWQIPANADLIDETE